LKAGVWILKPAPGEPQFTATTGHVRGEFSLHGRIPHTQSTVYLIQPDASPYRDAANRTSSPGFPSIILIKPFRENSTTSTRLFALIDIFHGFSRSTSS